MKIDLEEYLEREKEHEIAIQEELDYMYELGLYDPHEDAGDRI